MTDAQRDWRTFLVLAGLFVMFLSGYFVGRAHEAGLQRSLLATEEQQSVAAGNPVQAEVQSPPLSRLPEEQLAEVRRLLWAVTQVLEDMQRR